MEEIITLDGKQFKLTVDRPLTALEKEQVLADIRKQTGCGTCGQPKVARMGNDWQYGEVRSLGPTCPTPPAPGSQPANPKTSTPPDNTAVMTATPTQGVAPYQVEFRRIPFQSMTDLAGITAATVDGVTELVPNAKLTGGTNIATGVIENAVVGRTYAIEADDIGGATRKAGDTGPTIILVSKVIDSCATPQTCVNACKLYVACPAPTCDFTVV